jgi:hypothetical protein
MIAAVIALAIVLMSARPFSRIAFYAGATIAYFTMAYAMFVVPRKWS